ncbi:MAG: hypothetical protein OHK0023_26990 [Anaerolineae bacterium]
MNPLLQNWAIVERTAAMRDQLLASLTDAELNHTLGGQTHALRELYREQGAWQMAYIESFKTGKMSFVPPAVDPAHINSVTHIANWFQALDKEFKTVIDSLPDPNTLIDAAYMQLPAAVWLMTYRETLLILVSKLSIYFRSMGKPLPQQVIEWIG